jgi:hypothetical protein
LLWFFIGKFAEDRAVENFFLNYGPYVWASLGLGIVLVSVPAAMAQTVKDLFVSRYNPAANKRLLVLSSQWDEAWLLLVNLLAIKASASPARRIATLYTLLKGAYAQTLKIEALRYPARSGFIEMVVWIYPLLVLGNYLGNLPSLFGSILQMAGVAYAGIVTGYFFGRRDELAASVVAPLRLLRRIFGTAVLFVKSVGFKMASDRLGSVMKASGFGLDNFPFVWPSLSRTPKTVSEGFYEFGEIAPAVVARISQGRSSDIMRHVETLSAYVGDGKQLDPHELLKQLARNTRTVHAAYCLESEVIEQIGGWLARSEVDVYRANWGVSGDRPSPGQVNIDAGLLN